MRIPFVAVLAVLLATSVVRAQFSSTPGVVAPAATQTTPIEVETNRADGAAVAGINTSPGAGPSPVNSGLYGRGFIGLIAEGTTVAGVFRSQVGAGVSASAYSRGITSTCLAGACTAIQGEAHGQFVAGTGVVGIGSTGIRGVAVPSVIAGVPVHAGVFEGDVQITGGLSVGGGFASPALDQLRAEVADLTARLAALEARSSAGSGAGTIVPGRIQAESYDLGGPGVGYVDTTPGNEQGAPVLRADDVDIKRSSEGDYAIGWFAAGEWLAYSISVPTDGVYTLSARVGSVLPGRTFRIEVDGLDVSGELAVPQMADWDQYETVTLTGVSLAAGPHVLRIVMGPQDFMDLQWIEISQ